MDRYVSDRTAERIRKSVPENTRRAYARQIERFEAWCAEHGRTPLSATGETLAEYISHLCDLDLGPSSIDQAITAIRTQHRTNGYPKQPETEGARRVLKVHRRERADAGQRAHKAPSIVLERLRLMAEATPADVGRSGHCGSRIHPCRGPAAQQPDARNRPVSFLESAPSPHVQVVEELAQPRRSLLRGRSHTAAATRRTSQRSRIR